MGNSCTHAADAVVHLVSEEEIKEAVRSVEEWYKQQAMNVRTGGPGQNNYGPLLQRVGGPDVVKKVVELFYKKLYADPRLILFLHDQDVMHLRAKQSAFISWLFGPPNMPYLGRSVRIAHLRIIKQRGFNGDDYDLGMKYFEQAMAELGAPEVIMGEVMRRLRPFKDAFFTPCPKDAEEEARWVLEEREKAEAEAEAARQAGLAAQEEEAFHERERKLQEQITLAHRVAEAEAEDGDDADWAADAAVLSAALAASRAATRPSSRAGQCPFTGGRVSRPGTLSVSGALAAAAEVSAEGSPKKPRTPPTPPGAAAGPSSPTAAAAASGGATPAGASASVSRAGSLLQIRPGAGEAAAAAGDAAASSRPSSQPAAPGLDSSSGTSTAAGPADAVATVTAAAGASVRVPSPTAPPPGTPAAAAGRLGTASTPSAAAPSAPAAAPAAAAAPDPLAEFEAELNAIERAYSPDDGGRVKASGEQGAPLLPPTLETSSSSARRTAAVC